MTTEREEWADDERDEFQPGKVIAFVVALLALLIGAQDPRGGFASVVEWIAAVILFLGLAILIGRALWWLWIHWVRPTMTS